VPTFVIVGAGHAGGRAAEAMRKHGFDGRVILIGAEPHLPHERPPLSKGALLGTQDYESCLLHQRAFYDEQAIELSLGAGVAAVDCAAATLSLGDGQIFRYDKLLFTTGATPRRLGVPGADLPGVHYLRSIEDSSAIAAAFGERSRVVVIGGGFIGLEVAAAARERGCEVTVVEAADRLIGRAVPPAIGARLMALHETRGVHVRLGATVTAISGHDRVETVICEGEAPLAADLVVIGIGVAPETAVAKRAGLAVNDGILVNEFGETSEPGIYAAGDVARFYHPLFDRRLRLESWLHAEKQPAAVAGVMCGARAPYVEVPWLWSDQYDTSLQVAGVQDADERVVERGPPDGDKVLQFFIKDNIVRGVVGLGIGVAIGRDVRWARRLIENCVPVDPARLADLAVGLKELASASH